MEIDISATNQIRIFVINLARSADRREKMTRVLEKHHLEFQFFAGVDGSLLAPEQIASAYKASAAFDRLGRELHPNEIGCAWSHIKVYEMMVRNGLDEILIMEDDVDVSDELPAVLASRHLWLPRDWRLVNFAHDMATPIPTHAFEAPGLTHLSVCHFDQLVGRLGCYLINRQGADALLRHAYPIRMPSDDLGGDARFLGAPIYGITPRVAMWDEAYVSAIWTDTTRDEFALKCRSGFMGIMRRLQSRIKRRLGRSGKV